MKTIIISLISRPSLTISTPPVDTSDVCCFIELRKNSHSNSSADAALLSCVCSYGVQ